MHVALRAAPSLLIGFVLVGCAKESAKSDSGGQPSPKLDPSAPTVTLNVPGMH